MRKYNVYVIDPKIYYCGKSLVAAETAKRANYLIEEFVREDKKNIMDSYGYCSVSECDKIENLYSENEGIIYKGIYYCG